MIDKSCWLDDGNGGSVWAQARNNGGYELMSSPPIKVMPKRDKKKSRLQRKARKTNRS